MIYSAAKKNPALSLSWARAPEVGLPKPDAVVFLDLSPESAEERGGYGEEKYEKKEMQMMVRELFLGLLDGEGAEREMRVIDAGESVEEVGERIWDAVEGIVDAVEKGEFGIEVGIVKAWEETKA